MKEEIEHLNMTLAFNACWESNVIKSREACPRCGVQGAFFGLTVFRETELIISQGAGCTNCEKIVINEYKWIDDRVIARNIINE